MLMDFHIHTNTSRDSDMTVKEAYEKAVSKGVVNICITNHHEPYEIKTDNIHHCLIGEVLDRYVKEVKGLDDDTRGKLFLGVELGYDEESEDALREFLELNDFDFVIGSVHFVQGINIADRKKREKLLETGADNVCKEYFRKLKKAIRTGMFDVIGHIDVFRKTLPEMNFERWKSEWEDVARLLLETGTGFELNTARGLATYPSDDLLKMLISKGITKVTVGSDAHHTDEVSEGITEAEEKLEKLGVNRVYLFEKRKPIPIDLNTCKPELRT